MQVVSYFDEYYLYIIYQCVEYFMEVFCLGVFCIIGIIQFGEAIYDFCNMGFKLFLNIFQGYFCIFNNVVQKSVNDSSGLKFNFISINFGYSDRMQDVRFF